MSAAIWTLLGGVIVALITALASLTVALINRRPVEKSTDLALITAAADEWRELKDDYSRRLESAEQRLGGVEADNRAMQCELDALRRIEGLMLGWIVGIKQGIEDGSIPPMPEDPDWLVERLTRKP